MQPLSPLDGRYASAVDPLRAFFSEEALMGARLNIEVLYLLALADLREVRELRIPAATRARLGAMVESFGPKAFERVKGMEARTRHDVKALEYYLRDAMAKIPALRGALPFVHFGLTSEDVNNLSYGVLINAAVRAVIRPELAALSKTIARMGRRWANVPMLSLTHGQAATPTTAGKEMLVFAERLDRQIDVLKRFRMQGKLGGAVGNFSAHRAAYPDVDWPAFGRRFVRSLGLDPLTHTTQVNPHDDIAELSHLLARVNAILLDLSRDAWLYISRGVLRQKIVPGEVGSSTMPHKVNPIDFENAEGNLGLSTALFLHFAEKLPVSRLQRDLSDSTVQRNIGVAFGYHLLALKSLERGIGKIDLDRKAIRAELVAHPEVIAEAVQTVLRKHGIEDAYERLKSLTRGASVTRDKLAAYIEHLRIPQTERERLLGML